MNANSAVSSLKSIKMPIASQLIDTNPIPATVAAKLVTQAAFDFIAPPRRARLQDLANCSRAASIVFVEGLPRTSTQQSEFVAGSAVGNSRFVHLGVARDD
jgi:hypothetical protein